MMISTNDDQYNKPLYIFSKASRKHAYIVLTPLNPTFI